MRFLAVSCCILLFFSVGAYAQSDVLAPASSDSPSYADQYYSPSGSSIYSGDQTADLYSFVANSGEDGSRTHAQSAQEQARVQRREEYIKQREERNRRMQEDIKTRTESRTTQGSKSGSYNWVQ